MHVNARGLALGIIATIAFVYALQWAQKFLVPLLLGIFIAYTLNPVVSWLERWHVKRVFGATIVTVAILVVMGGVLHRVQDEFFNIIDDLPNITQKVTRIMTNSAGGQPSTIQQVQAHLLAHQYEARIEKSQLRGRKKPGAKSGAPKAPARR